MVNGLFDHVCFVLILIVWPKLCPGPHSRNQEYAASLLTTVLFSILCCVYVSSFNMLIDDCSKYCRAFHFFSFCFSLEISSTAKFHPSPWCGFCKKTKVHACDAFLDMWSVAFHWFVLFIILHLAQFDCLSLWLLRIIFSGNSSKSWPLSIDS